MENVLTADDVRKLKALGIAALILFGSRTQGINKADSDYDIGILLADNTLLKQLGKRKEIYEKIYETFSERINKLVNFDIVFLETAPGELKAHVMKHGKVIFETNPSVFANFKEKVILEYSDFAPIRKMFQEAILSRIK